MTKTIRAIYEHGVLRPFETLDLKEAQVVKVTLEALPSVVEETQALIQARAEIVKEVAEGDEYLPEEPAA
jgi:predicted DNA-binding antitoxin AbrB/MazE fold protein